MCFIPLSFDPRVIVGKIRAPSKVTLNGHSQRDVAQKENGNAGE
jgi:hypothetical protein